MLGLVAFGATLPRLPLPVFDRQSVAPLRSTPQVWEAPTFGEKSELPASVPSMPSRSIDWSELALYAYTTITFVFLLRFVTGMLLARRLLTRSNPAGPGFLESAMIAAPLTIGVTRPKILLPLGWRKWDRDKLNAVLACRARTSAAADGSCECACRDQPLHLLVPSHGVVAGTEA